MKRLTFVICAVSMLVFACNNEKSAEAKNETPKDSTGMAASEEAWVPVDSAKMMQDMIAYGTPGPMHALLASWNGTWTADMSMWWYEGGEPMKSTGTAVNTMMLNGKYQQSKHSGMMMGEKFEGVQTTAYDNATKQFTSVWADNMSTGLMYMTGNWDEATKTLTWTGKSPDISRPGKECSFRQVLKVVDDNTHHFEMYGPDPKTGKEYKMMEADMKRK